MLFCSNISKSYGEVKALESVSFEVGEAELFGLIGPDGAGKTTMIRIVATLLLADEGEATVLGWDAEKDYQKIRNSLGYMPGKFSLYQDLSIAENLHLFASLFGVKVEDNMDLIEDIYEQLRPFAKRKAGDLSGGMKQKLALCCALIHAPKLLLLDEPTTGVDAVSRKEFWQMLKRLKSRGISILVSTPYMDEAALCDRVALIQNGKIMQIDSPQNIVDQFPVPLFAISGKNTYGLLQSLRKMPHARSVQPFGNSIHYTDDRASITEDILFDEMQSLGHSGLTISRLDASIEDCFMELM